MAFNITKNFTVTNARQVPYVPPGASQILIDKYFGSTTLLLQADTTNTGTIVDSSTNNFVITSSGTIAQGSVTPFTTEGGSIFIAASPTSSNLSIPNSSGLVFGTGDFTMECWVYMSSISATANTIYDSRPTTTQGAYPAMYFTSGQLIYATNGVNSIIGGAAVANTWYHCALSRVSGVSKLFLNGAQVGSNFTDGNNLSCGTVARIGNLTYFSNGQYPLNGYISNFRILKGTGLYSASFTVPTSPLTTITNTSVLLKGENASFFDKVNSNNILVGGTLVPTSSMPFSISTSPDLTMFTGTSGGTGNGTGYAAVYNSNIANFGTSAWTIEGWVKYNNVNTDQLLFDSRTVSGATFASTIYLGSADSKLRWFTNNATVFTSSVACTANTWYHVAVVKTGAGAATTMYLNGTSVGSFTDSNTYVSATPICIGGQTNSTLGINATNGYISNFRITKGVARYTASFTPPQTKLPANGATGGTITYSGADVIHTFLSTGTFKTTTQISAAALVVAAGGGGGSGGGGGGAGGYISSSIAFSSGAHSVTVGVGGAGGSAHAGGAAASITIGKDGTNSVISSLTAIAGGGGAGGSTATTGSFGGSGGGANWDNTVTGSGTVGQGFAGGKSTNPTGNPYGMGGGGGASAAGSNATSNGAGSGGGGAGGAGNASTISGTSVTYAGGGGGGSFDAGSGGAGGAGGGGAGVGNSAATATSGTANTGAGGGGGGRNSGNTNSYGAGGNGGSGIVIVRYTSTS